MAVNISLKGLRCNADYSLEDVADALGVSRETYRKKENNKSELLLKEGFVLSELFKCSIEDIYNATQAD